MKRGFTLVELSIVLVIIGLLIGGILAAQSMISAAKLQTFTRQVQQLDIAVNNFQTKYNSIPGDTTLFQPPGDGNGLLDTAPNQNNECPDDNYGVGPNGDGTFTESSEFLVHLQQSDPGFLPQYKFIAVGSADTNGPNNFGANLPEATTIPITYGIKGSIFVTAGYCTDQTNQLPNNINGDGSAPPAQYLIEDFYDAGNNNSDLLEDVGNPVFAPAEALAYDKKVDDGLPLSGTVHGTTGTNCINGSNQYDTTQTQPQCDLSIKMLSQVGQ